MTSEGVALGLYLVGGINLGYLNENPSKWLKLHQILKQATSCQGN